MSRVGQNGLESVPQIAGTLNESYAIMACLSESALVRVESLNHTVLCLIYI